MYKNLEVKMKSIEIYKKFMININPNFFNLSKKEQDLYKVSIADSHNNTYLTWVYKNAFNKVYDEDIILNNKEELIINESLLYFEGIGENYYQNCENIGTNDNQLTFKTLYEYDKNNYEYKKEMLLLHNSTGNIKENDLISEEYSIHMHGDWSRALINNKFQYLILTSAHSFISDIIDDYSSCFVEGLGWLQ